MHSRAFRYKENHSHSRCNSSLWSFTWFQRPRVHSWPNARNIFRVQTTPFTCHVLKKTFAFQNRLHFSHGLAARWKRNVTRWISIVFPRIFRLSHIQPIGSNISEKIPSKLDELFCMKDCLRTLYIYCLIVIYRIKTSIQFLIKIFWHFFFNLFMISYRIFKYVSGRIFIKFFFFLLILLSSIIVLNLLMSRSVFKFFQFQCT